MASSATIQKRHSTSSSRSKERLTCRQVLNLMVILGFMFNYMLRVNLTLAITEMVHDDDDDLHSTTTYNNPDNNSSHAHLRPPNLTATPLLPSALTKVARGLPEDTPLPTTNNRTHFPAANEPPQPHVVNVSHADATVSGKFHWNKHEQNLIFGSFFWGYVLTELPGGRLAEVVGAKKVFGGGMLMASVLTLLTPLACHTHFTMVVALRALVGFFLGATFPATPPMAAKWIPPLERSKFIANMMASSLGAALTMPLSGYLVQHCGWASVFYVTGAIGFVWTCAWFYLVYDSPAQHPRITAEERMEIEAKIEEGTDRNAMKPSRVPWRAMLLSGPVWAIIITHGCSVFGYFTVVHQLPTYMKDVLKFEITQNGWLSSLPYLGKYVMAVAASYWADRLRNAGRLTTTTIRKAFTMMAVLVPGLLMAVEALFGYDPLTSVCIFTLSLFFNGAVTAGYLSNGLDIAPNFSGTIMGMANTVSSMGGFLSTRLVAVLTNDDHTFASWKYVFWVLAFIYALGAITFQLLGTGTMQSWNSVLRAEPQELQPLKKRKELNDIKA